ncbi:hypothetical protein B0H34DRAFT_731840 [Crassisporium funariophilum]|nr:hypothetical protein B0H34DRAFT_731840 [Crassisporium funariophilum]
MVIEPRTLTTIDYHMSSLPPYFLALRNSNVKDIVNNATTEATIALKRALALISTIELQNTVKQLIGTIADQRFAAEFMHAIKEHIVNHPFETAFLVIGIVLMCNPVARVGFGSFGPVAGSLVSLDPHQHLKPD